MTGRENGSSPLHTPKWNNGTGKNNLGSLDVQIFQQDGAPSYTSHGALDWLEESVDVIVGWPLNSPDLSPRELLWVILKKLIRKVKPQTIEELKSSLLAAWAMIPQDTIDRLCEGFAIRLQLCFANHGNSIDRVSHVKCSISESHD
jgi:transposase